MKLARKAGATSQIFQVFIRDSSSTTGAGLTGLVFNSASLTAYYHRDTDTTATAITLVTMTVGTFTSSGFKEIDATNMPGWYQFCPPNAALAAGAASCGFHLKGATNMAPLPIEVDLDPQVDVHLWNGTAVATPATAGIPDTNVKNINNVAAATPGAAGGVLISGSNTGTTTLGALTVTGATTLTGAVSLGSTLGVTGTTTLAALTTTGTMTVNAFTCTNNFTVSGNWLTTGTTTWTGAATFTGGLTSNITGNLVGTVSTLTTYTGNTPQTGDSFARIGAAGAGLTALGDTRIANLDAAVSTRLSTAGYTAPPSAATIATAVLTTAMTESYAADGATFTLAQGMYMLWSSLSEFAIASTTITAKKLDGSTTAMTFTLDSATIPTSRTRAT